MDEVKTILALDPGSRLVGAALLYWDGSRVSYLRGGHYELGDEALALDGAQYVILETLAGYAYSLARVKDMVLTARMEGEIIGLARGAGIMPLTISAGEARGLVCASPAASNEQIAIVVEALIEGAPKSLRKAGRQHIYDACLYGLAGLIRLGVRLTLPDAAMTALHVRRSEERAKSSAKSKATKAKRAAAGWPGGVR